MPPRVRDYAAEYRARTTGARSPEERQRMAGHRGPARFEDALRTATYVRIRGKYSDQVVATVTDRRGKNREFILQRKGPKTARQADRMQRQVERHIDQMDSYGTDYDVSVSP